jgi:hypothetical protein
MNKLFITLCLMSSALFAYPNHSPELASPLKVLYKLEEAKSLLEAVEAEGSFTMKTARLGMHASNAAWYPDMRTICVNVSNKRSQGSMIRSLIFELHNALNQKKFDQMDRLATQGKISKQNYILEIEQLEYENALQTVKVLNAGIKKGIFPKDAFWPIASSFQEHMQIQLEAGHAQNVGALYDQLRSGHFFAGR